MKNKERNGPNKKQNNYGCSCQYADNINDEIICELGIGDAKICKGNRHNCVKVKYHNNASLSDKQKY